MKYKIWQTKWFDLELNVVQFEKVDVSHRMFISPDGNFMAFGENDDGTLWIMPSRPDFYELEILE